MASNGPNESATHGGSTYQNKVNSSAPPPESSDTDLDGWKYRPPYKIQSNDPDFHPLYHGSCHCGKIKFQLGREAPLDAKYCHCQTCQKLHGAPFQWCAIFHKTDINFTSGHHDLGWYESSEKTCEHKLPCKVSCAYCRTPIMDEGRNMILLFPTLLQLDEEAKKKFMPSCHMFYPRRVVDVADNLTKWSGINNESEIVGGEGEGKRKNDGQEVDGVEAKKKKEELGEEYHHWEKNH